MLSDVYTESWCQCPETVKERAQLAELMNDTGFRAMLRLNMASAGAHVRELVPDEKEQVRECLRWLHAQPIETPEEYQKALQEAGEKWPAVKMLIGW